MDNKNNNPKVPNLRFPEFVGEWKKYYVSDLLETFPTNSLSWDHLSYEDGILKNIHYGLIHNGFKTTCIDVQNSLIPFIKEENHPNKYTLLKTGDLILADASENRQDVGKPIEIINKTNINAISGLHTIHMREHGNLIALGFKGFYFQSKPMKSQIYKIANGSKIYGMSPSNFKELYMCLPNSSEQEKIVLLLNKIEQKIETQSKIIDAYSSLIKAIEEKLFWNNDILQHKYKISEMLNEKTEKSSIQNQYPILSSTKKGVFLQSDYFNKAAASSNNIGYKITQLGDIIISPQNLWMGNITFNNKFVNGLVSPSYHVYKINENFNPIYVARLLQTNRALFMYNTISEQGASIVRRNLNIDSFNDLSFPMPNIKEQDKIGLFLNEFHQLINLEKTILKQYNNQKKFLLDNIFI